MFNQRENNKFSCNYVFPPQKLRYVYCLECKHQFFLQGFVPLNGIVPLLLKCGHVICDKCGSKGFNKPCPICKTVLQSKDNQNFLLPVNMYALGLMVVSHNRPVDLDDSNICFYKSATSKLKKQSVQGLCHECGFHATVRCPQCIALYCHKCYFKIHGRALQSHTKIILSEEMNENSFTIQTTCSDRCVEPLGYYCEDCEIAVCSHCMLRLHTKHNYAPLINKNKELIPQFYEVSERIAENLQRIRQAQKKLKSIILQPSERQNNEKVESAITQHFAHLHGILQNVEKKIIDSLHEQCVSKDNNIDEIDSQLKDHEERLQSAYVISSTIDEMLGKVDIQQVIKKLMKLINIPSHLVVNSVPENQEARFHVDDSIVDAIKNHCTIDVPPVSTFSLVRTDLLPDDYEIEPLLNESICSNFQHKPFLPLQQPSTSSVVTLPPRKTDNHLVVGFSEAIRVTHVVNPFCFYVQLIKNQNKIAELNKGLAMLANTTGVIPTDVTLNALYMVQCARDRTWYRGRVIGKVLDDEDQERYTVIFIDYGMKEDNVPLKKMRNIIPQFAMLPVLALRCALFDIVPNNGKWNEEGTQAFKKLVCTNTMISMRIMMITGDTYYVDLCAISSRDSCVISIKDMLTYAKHATCSSQTKLLRTNPDSTQVYYKEQLELEVYTEVQVKYVESPNCIYVQKARGNRSYYNKLIRDMTEYYEQTSTLNSECISVPCKDLPCAAQATDGFWHRGQIREVTENTVKVFYVDLGYTSILSYDAIRTLPKKFMTCKTQAIRVSLTNIKPLSGNTWAPEANKYLRKLLINFPVLRTIAFEKIKDRYNVAMYTPDKNSICHLLVKKQLAISIKSNNYFVASANTRGHRKKSNAKKKVATVNRSNEEPVNKPCNSLNSSVMNKSASENTEDPFKIGVTIHQALSPECIYVSDTSCEQDDVQEMMKEMQIFYGRYRSAKPEIWTKDAACAVYSTQRGYCRGRIVNVKSKDKIIVYLCDLGMEETVSYNDLQVLPPEFCKMPSYVFKIKLSGILPCGGSTTWPSLSCEELREIVNSNYNCKFYISKLDDEDMEDSTIPVELWIKQAKLDGPLTPTRIEINSVNRMLVDKGVALPIKEYAKKRDKILAIELKRHLKEKAKRLVISQSDVKWFKIDDELGETSVNIETPQKVLRYSDSNSNSDIQENNTEEVLDNIPSLPTVSTWLPPEPISKNTFIAVPTYLDHSGFLYLHSIEQNKKSLDKIEAKLEKLYRNCTLEVCDTVWIAGNLCIAQYHGNKKWYRGEVVEVLENDLIKVKFVDYGNVEECSIGTVKKKVILEHTPVQCTKCLIHGLKPKTNNGKWITADLDRVHALLIDQECEVTVLETTDTHLVITITLLPNKFCKQRSNLISFLINEWEMNIEPFDDGDIFGKDLSTTDNSDVVIEEDDFNLPCSDDEIVEDAVISGCSVLLPHTDAINENESCTTTDIENFSWRKAKNVISSTPHVTSTENLTVNNKLIDVLQEVKCFEVELSCSVSAITFFAQLKENEHEPILNNYYKQYENLMSDLQENAYKQPMITSIVPNTPCCAEFNDGIWYRCLVVETEHIENTKNIEIKLLYIDYGNDEYRTINSEKCELYILKEEWADLPAMAIKCTLWNIEIVASANYSILISQIEQMYSKHVIATVKEVYDDIVCVELYEDKNCEKLLYHTLIEDGLFQIKLKKY
ncbi:uncharacterized protein LOC128886369 isoform X1 [Hylaeus anthracinus]|uniref:uncharacterized protein LOC128886369 isoform X1 n=1 Tax=Hylaeus anthracinus TaxID=313031 RepID=UPI0023B917D7|nr:uncharacterized protein LOC128886369 isoform X1 [Hylaeus anthracinus]